MKKTIGIILCLILLGVGITGCKRQDSASNNSKIKQSLNSGEQTDTVTEAATAESTQMEEVLNEDSPCVQVGSASYYVDIEADKTTYAGAATDIVVGDNLYATQINDWYLNPDQYLGKIVEIEGYYLDFDPYTMVGRKGPSCPYCTGGYVSFEFLTDTDMSKLVSESDWIKVKGILQQGDDSLSGAFYYIEALSVEKMEEVGIDTVTN